MRTGQRRGFTLIELLIVVAIIGILAAIAVPNLLAAMQRSRQKRTMADMRNIANAWEARHVDESRYLPAGQNTVEFPSSVALDWPTVSSMLTPTYLREVPQKDAWGNEFQFRCDNANYFIRSAGKGGGFEGNSYTFGTTKYFECDIVYSNGNFVVYPEGVQLPTTTSTP